MSTLFTFSTLLAYLDSEGIEYDADPEDGVVTFGIQGDEGVHDVYFDFDDVTGYLLCGARPPVSFGPEALPRIYETVCRANHLLPLGGFQVSSEDCQLIFVVGIPIEGSDLSPEQLEALLGTAIECSDLYLPAFTAILGGADIQAALAAVENRADPERRE